MLTRRQFNLAGIGATFAAGTAVRAAAEEKEMFEITKTPAEWKKILSGGSVLRAARARYRARRHQPAG